MASQPLNLTTLISQAVKSYEASWKTVDSELYDLFRRRPSHRDFADVYTKVAIIGRIYAAGLPRTVRGDVDAETAVALGLIEQAEMLEARLRDLADCRLDRGSIGEIVDLNARIGRGLLAYTDGVWQQSFVSKYLHFHYDQVPILDARAEGAIGRYVSWPDVYRLRKSVGKPEDWRTRYYNFATAFLTLYEQTALTSAPPTVKELDYLLWQPQ